MSISLALIGKNISHSKSEQMYRKILKSIFSYTLIDCENESLIPSLEYLFPKYSGVSITSPYKKHFIDNVIIDKNTQKIGAINCIKFKNNIYYGYNTDYLAIEEIIKSNDYLSKEIIILGDGAMANVLKVILDGINKKYKSYSRRLTGDISKIDFSINDQSNLLIINCCSRTFNFEGSIPKDSVFWDLNYSHDFHKISLTKKCIYIDGEELLLKQAQHAVKIWGID